MSRFVLIHGACHGGWCWHKIRPRLEKLGHRIECPDLPAHGRDRTPLEKVSLNRYAESVASVVASDDEPAVLVGHSLGGLVMSETVSLVPTSVKSLVFLTGFMLIKNETIHHVVAKDTESLLVNGFDIDSEASVATPRNEAVRDVFYNDCSDEDIALAQMSLVPAAIKPNDEMLSEPMVFGQFPCFYIECALDRAITVAAQREMHRRFACDRVVTLEAGHSPFFSKPDALAACLDTMAQ